MKFTIERSKWLRGQGSTVSALLCDNGKMCCLGFYALSHGSTSESILNVKSPEQSLSKDWAEKLVRGDFNNSVCELLMTTNDRIDVDDAAREASLTELFASIGVEVEFVD